MFQHFRGHDLCLWVLMGQHLAEWRDRIRNDSQQLRGRQANPFVLRGIEQRGQRRCSRLVKHPRHVFQG